MLKEVSDALAVFANSNFNEEGKITVQFTPDTSYEYDEVASTVYQILMDMKCSVSIRHCTTHIVGSSPVIVEMYE